MTTRARSYTCPFTTRNQRIKTLEKLGQAIKQAPRYESSDQGLIFEIKIFDRRRSWKYRAYSGDYPLTELLGPDSRGVQDTGILRNGF